jgi:hypothetical protein
MTEVKWGSSPHVSEPRPQRASRKMLMCGVQHVSALVGVRGRAFVVRVYVRTRRRRAGMWFA